MMVQKFERLAPSYAVVWLDREDVEHICQALSVTLNPERYYLESEFACLLDYFKHGSISDKTMQELQDGHRYDNK